MKKKNPTREDVIRILKGLAAEGKQPSRKALEQKGINGYWVGKLVPETLPKLKHQLGIKIVPQERPYSDDELFEKIDNAVSHFGAVPSWTQLRRETKISDKTFINRFGKQGKLDVFRYYLQWLKEHRPESGNMGLVSEYLDRQEKTKILTDSEIQDEDRQKLATRFKSLCEHCGNITYKSQISSHKVKITELDLVEYKLYECEICEHIVLRKESSRFAKAFIPSTPIPHVEQLWPPELLLPSVVPERIRKIYEEARSVKSKSPSSFVVQIRRALEAVAKDRNAEGKVLLEQINWLIDHEHLPQVFGQMGHITRMIANLGAHDAEIDVQPSVADIADEFFRAIMEYIYIAPAKVTRIKALMEKK